MEQTGDHFGPRARNTLGEVICLNCGTHREPVVGTEITCSNRCKMQLHYRGGRMDWREFRLRVAEIYSATAD